MATKTRAHGLDRVLSLALEPWALTRPMVAIVARVLGRRLSGDVLAFDDEPFERRAPQGPVTSGGLAVIPIHGCIAPRMNAMTDISGGATFEEASRALDAAVSDPAIQTILLDVDSPGGSVLGASEFARRVMAARTKKPIVACVNYQCCSAAYWFAAAATEIIAAPSSTSGSVGIYTIHEDLSVALEQAGVKLTYVSAGKFKVDGNEAEPLSETAYAHLKSQVDAHYARMVGDIAKGRGVTDAAVRDGFGQGATVAADEALALGMIDRIATFEETVARYLPASSRSSAAIAALTYAGLTAPAPVAAAPPTDTPHEPPPATGHDRMRERRAAELALLALNF